MSILQPLNTISVATIHTENNPRIVSHNRPSIRKEVANGQHMLVEDWWKNTGNDIYNKVINPTPKWNLEKPAEYQPNGALKAKQDFWDAPRNYDQNAQQPVLRNNMLKTNGLNFNDTKAVQQWLTDNGFNTKGVDGMYGANTKAAIDELLSSNKFVLTQAEKEAFRNFQNNATFVRAKQPAKVETPATVKTTVVEQPIQNQSQQTIVEEKPIYYDTKYIPGQGEIVLNPETQNNSSGLGKSLHDAFIWMGDNGMFQKKPNYGGTGALHKQGGTLIKKHQQGGTMEQQEQQELQLALMGYIVVTKKQPKDENEINQLAQALMQLKQQDPKQFAQLVQLGQQAQAQKAEKGAKINYLKSLKGQCPEGEELVYFKKGGMIGCGCKKKEKGGEMPKKKLNAIEEFKKGRKC